MLILAGDIGGTNTRLQLLDAIAAQPVLVREAHYASRNYVTLAAVLRDFLAGGSIAGAAACFGIAGPVRAIPTGQSVRTTNLPWEIDSSAIAREFGFGPVHLINDFQAIGYGIEALAATELVTLQAGEPLQHGTRAVIGAGTGLGQGILVWQGTHYEAIATEGGHVDFAPTNELDFDLAKHLRVGLGRASYEDILSGPGLVRLYGFFRQRGGLRESQALAKALEREDPAAAITEAALVQGDPLANAALDCFVRIYGAQAGNLALSAGASGGLYVAGGIAPRILPRLQRGDFLAAFGDKGSMAHFVQAVPVSVVRAADVGLRGAARVAARLASGTGHGGP